MLSNINNDNVNNSQKNQKFKILLSLDEFITIQTALNHLVLEMEIKLRNTANAKMKEFYSEKIEICYNLLKISGGNYDVT